MRLRQPERTPCGRARGLHVDIMLKPGANAGFSMIEVLVSILILAIGLLSLAGPLALVGAVYLIAQAPPAILVVGGVLLIAGMLVYAFLSPRERLAEAKRRIQSEEHRLAVMRYGLRVGPARALRALRDRLRR
jgi:prepilin-type N-terminal cleavage/methylation domain-containing protein